MSQPPPPPPTDRLTPADASRPFRSCLSLCAGCVACFLVLGFCLTSAAGLAWWRVRANRIPDQPGSARNDPAVRHTPARIKSGGVGITVDQFEPARPGKYPVVLVVHGFDGLKSAAWRRYYTGQCQELARHGHVAVLVHYFERTGTDKADVATTKRHVKTWALTLLDALSHATQLPSAGAGRVGIVGTSFGAVIAVSLGLLDPRIGAVVQISGVLPEEMLVKVRNQPPLLILHGGADPYIPLHRVSIMQRLLEEKKVPVEAHIYPRQRHVFKGPDAADALARTVTFFQTHLK